MKKGKSKKTGSIFFYLWGIFVGAVLILFGLFWAIWTGRIGYLPPLEELQNPKYQYACEIYSSDMQVIGRYYKNANRTQTHYNELTPNLINALIATEDIRFYNHSGIDFFALFRSIVHFGRTGGASTITQQLAKQLWSPSADNALERIMQKFIEWVIAIQLERLYSKDEIILMYLNQFDFLYNAVGIKNACSVYFATTPDKLTLEQAATLIGMLKNPAVYNPIRNVEKTTSRRNIVLKQMEKYGYLSSYECDSLSNLPLTVYFNSTDHKKGIAPYFREYLRQVLTATEPNKRNYNRWTVKQFPLDKYQWDNNPLYGFCNKNKKPDGSSYNLYQDGLKIYTTLDSRMQQAAEEALSEHIRALQKTFFKEKKSSKNAPYADNLSEEEVQTLRQRAMYQTDRYRGLKRKGIPDNEIQKIFDTPIKMRLFSYYGNIDTLLSPMDSIMWYKHFLRCGFMAIDPFTGHVKAYIGGPDFEHFQYDMCINGRRQIGSTVKPFLYTLAMNEGMWPCDKTTNDSITLFDVHGNPWTPRDEHTQNIGEEVTLDWGLRNSSNWISAYLMSLFTPEQLVQLMRSFGIQGELDPVVSLCLGPCEVSIQEMVDAYTTFVNKGIRTDPLFVTKIEDKNGNTIATFSPRTTEVISESTSYKMIYMLRNVIDHGTGVRLRYTYNISAPIGGKTGTSQNNSDGWFVGFTPSLVAACWVGGEERSIHFNTMRDGQGANTALPIYALFMKKIYGNPVLPYNEKEQFDIPKWFNPESGCK